MATGRQMKLAGQTGDNLVAAELGRRVLIATTFAGNVPDYDIIASTEKGKHISVQVRTIHGSTWQFGNIDKKVKDISNFEDRWELIEDLSGHLHP